MRPRILPAAAVLCALLACLLLLCAPAAAEDQQKGFEIIWNETTETGVRVYVRVHPFPEGGASWAGMVLNAFYNESRADGYWVVLVAYNWTRAAPRWAIFELYDYWTGERIGVYNVSGRLEVRVPGNVTVFYIEAGGDRLGPFYIATFPPVSRPPENVALIAQLLVAALIIAFAARGSAREAALGLIAASVIIVPFAKTFGASFKWLSVLPAFCLAVGLVLFVVSIKKRPS